MAAEMFALVFRWLAAHSRVAFTGNKWCSVISPMRHPRGSTVWLEWHRFGVGKAKYASRILLQRPGMRIHQVFKWEGSFRRNTRKNGCHQPASLFPISARHRFHEHIEQLSRTHIPCLAECRGACFIGAFADATAIRAKTTTFRHCVFLLAVRLNAKSELPKHTTQFVEKLCCSCSLAHCVRCVSLRCARARQESENGFFASRWLRSVCSFITVLPHFRE